MKNWILKDKTPVEVEVDSEDYKEFYSKEKPNLIKHHSIVLNSEEINVVTILFPIDLNPYGFNPKMIATMVMGGEHDTYSRSYSSYEEAEQGHKETMEMILK